MIIIFIPTGAEHVLAHIAFMVKRISVLAVALDGSSALVALKVEVAVNAGAYESSALVAGVILVTVRALAESFRTKVTGMILWALVLMSTFKRLCAYVTDSVRISIRASDTWRQGIRRFIAGGKSTERKCNCQYQ